VTALRRTAALALAMALAATGCGPYSFNASRLPGHIKTVAIPVFENVTPEPGLEQEVTQAVTAEFVRDNTLRVVPESRADSGLYGRVIRYQNRVFGYNAQAQTEEYEVVIEVQVEFKDLVKRKSLWKEEAVLGRTTYFVVATVGQAPKDEVTGRSEAIRNLASDLLNRTVRSWS
jgi:outer membrane lipopolysaccharide assembly protein LptE/RlpB